MISNKTELDKARRYAFLLLKFRLRSQHELARRLMQKGYSQEAVKSTVSFLKEKGFLDDEEFAGQWIASRLRKPYGSRRIASELKIKGIDAAVIQRKLQQAGVFDSEHKTAACLARARLAQLKGIEPAAARRRVYAYLIRRGFLPEAASDILNQL